MNKINSELILTLLSIKGIGRKTVAYLSKTGLTAPMSEENILTVLEMAKANKKRVPAVDLNQIREAKMKASSITRTCIESNIGIITVLDDDYPEQLKYIDDLPVILFYKGNKECLTNYNGVAVIGTRSPSEHGKKIAHRLGYIFGSEGLLVVSGLANGCDTYAHEGCLEGKGKTLAILPCGLDSVYPVNNKQLADRILSQQGCLVSEYLPGQTATRHFLVDRDRLQSAFSSGIAVVECGETSGTMHTVKFAKEQTRLVSCYEHKSTFSEREKIKGNLKILEESTTIILKDSNSIKDFINKLTEVKHTKEQQDIETEDQIRFI